MNPSAAREELDRLLRELGDRLDSSTRGLTKRTLEPLLASFEVEGPGKSYGIIPPVPIQGPIKVNYAGLIQQVTGRALEASRPHLFNCNHAGRSLLARAVWMSDEVYRGAICGYLFWAGRLDEMLPSEIFALLDARLDELGRARSLEEDCDRWAHLRDRLFDCWNRALADVTDEEFIWTIVNTVSALLETWLEALLVLMVLPRDPGDTYQSWVNYEAALRHLIERIGQGYFPLTDNGQGKLLVVIHS